MRIRPIVDHCLKSGTGLPLLSVLLGTLFLTACGDQGGPTQPAEDLRPRLGTQSLPSADPSAACSPVAAVPLVAGNGASVAGSVEVANDEDALFVTLRTIDGWVLRESHLAVAGSDDDLPVNRGGSPVPGQFPHSSRHGPGTTSFTYEIPLDGWGFGEPLAVAAHANVELGDREEGAWGGGDAGESFPGRSWATWFSHEPAECVSGLVTPGASSTLQVGGLTLQVPAGAVSEPVQITILPASIQDLGSSGGASETTASPGMGGGASMDAFRAQTVVPSLEFSDVTAIPGTVYDLGPDGLEFNEGFFPTLSIEYVEEEVLAAGFQEQELGLFILNGIFLPLESTVDAASNTVSGPIPHFTMALSGGFRKADLEVILEVTPDPVAVGGELVHEVTVENHGPTDITAVSASLIVEGNVAIQSPGQEGCTDLFETSPPKKLLVDCPVGDLDSGESKTLTMIFVPQVEGETLTSTARVDDFEGALDPDDSNDQATETTEVYTPPTGDPDLVPVTATFSESSTDVLSHELVIENQGTAPADLTNLSVMTWFSDDQTLDPSTDDISCGIQFSDGSLGAGESTTVTFNCDITGQTGVYLLYQVDRFDRVSESDETNNVLALQYGPIPTGEPDLVPISATYTSLGEDALSHQIVIKNVGTGIADLYRMTVMTWFSEDETLDTSVDDISCGLMFSEQTLIPGETVTGTFNCNISGQSGAFLLYQVDRFDRVSESDETNNVLALSYGG